MSDFKQYRVQLIILFLTVVASLLGYDQYTKSFQTAEMRALVEQVLHESDRPTNFEQAEVSADLVASQTAELVMAEVATVASVQDGDTITLIDGRKVRYIGIDAPERKGSDPTITCFNDEAYQANKKLVDGKTVYLQKDKRNTDKYGRLLRYVYVGGRSVNATLLAEGYARSKWYAPDTQKQAEFDAVQRQAQQDKKGLWGTCVK